MKRIPLKMQLLAAEQELKDFSELFDLQRTCSIEANKMWQHDTGEKYFPGLGELLRYFMAQRELMYKLYWILREGGYASDEYADIMESIERKDFCRSNNSAAHAAQSREASCWRLNQMDGDRLGMAITNRVTRCGSSPRCRVDVKVARAGSIPAPSSNTAAHMPRKENSE